MNGVEEGDNADKSGGNEKGSGITLCLFENPLTHDFSGSLLVSVPESARQPER